MKLLLKHEWRNPLLQLSLVALIVAISAMSTITFFTDRLQRGLQGQQRELLGGDYALRSDQLLPVDKIKSQKPDDVLASQVISFLSMVSTEGKLQLASIKAVDDRYPLLGQVSLVENLSITNLQRPSPGDIWIDKELSTLLQLKLGESCMIGRIQFTVTAILDKEPDQGERWFAIAPRVIMHLDDLASTGVIIPGARLQDQMMFVGEASSLSRFIEKLTPTLSDNEKLLSATDYQPSLAKIIEQIRHYLELGTLLTLLLASVTITLSLLRYLRTSANTIALLRCFGLRLTRIILHFGALFASLGLVAALLGCLIGFGAQTLLASLLSQFINLTLPVTSFYPALWASFSGLLLLFGVCFPLLLSVKSVTPTHLFQQKTISITWLAGIIQAVVGVCLISLLYWYTQDAKLTVLMTLSIVALVIFLIPVNRLLLYVINLSRDWFSLTWQFAVANLYRQRRQTSLELLTLSLIITVFLLITLIRNDVVEQWKHAPESTPNYFMINISPDELSDFKAFLRSQQLTLSEFYPMVRGRLFSLNGIPILEALPPEKHIHNALNRALNFTWVNTPPNSELVSQGVWWPIEAEQRGEPLVSLESGLATQLGFKLGDKIGVQIQSDIIEVTYINTRKVQWRSFQPNFYMIFPKPILEKFPRSFITSIYIPENKLDVLRELNQRFPAVTLLDVSAIAKQFQQALDNLAYTIEFILIFIIIASLLILVSTLLISLDYRAKQHAVIRALGGSRGLLKRILLFEFALLGIMGGTMAVIFANTLAAIFSSQVLEFTYVASIWIWVFVPLVTAIIIAVVSYMVDRKTLNVTPASALK